MKSINQIFKSNTTLLDEPEVQELIEYCKELEEQLIEIELSKPYNKEDKLADLVREIYTSCKMILKQEEENIRWPELNDRPDFKKAILNLQEYLESFSRDNKFSL